MFFDVVVVSDSGRERVVDRRVPRAVVRFVVARVSARVGHRASVMVVHSED